MAKQKRAKGCNAEIVRHFLVAQVMDTWFTAPLKMKMVEVLSNASNSSLATYIDPVDLERLCEVEQPLNDVPSENNDD